MRLASLLGIVTACQYTPPRGADDEQTPDAAIDDGPSVRRLVPSNHADTSPLEAADLPDLVMDHVDVEDPSTVWRIYTDTGLIEHEVAGANAFAVYRAASIGPDEATKLLLVHAGPYAVLYVRRFEVAVNVSLEGYGSRPLIVIAQDGILVRGEIDFSGGLVSPSAPSSMFDPRIGGPGGGDGGFNNKPASTFIPARGCGGGTALAGIAAGGEAVAGGGGGGGGAAGAKGGDRQGTNDLGGTGGLACMTAALIPLVGGGGGGAGDFGDDGGHGGAGGGALQLTSLTSITIEGVIDAGGKGGRGSFIVATQGGGGGGAGGGVLLEAPSVTLAANAVIAANGGGGGSGRTNLSGQQGTLTTQPAAGGTGSGAPGVDGRGGNGGALTAAATAGDDHDPGGGGGGGAPGVIRFNTDPDMLLVDSTTILSPQPTDGLVAYDN
jgi:hypothetical protein